MKDCGIVRPGSLLRFGFDTFNSTGSSVTMTGFAVTDIEIYKDGSTTQRSSDNGYTLVDTDGTDIDGITGIQEFTVDLADNSVAGFYAAGSQYRVIVSSVTVDGSTVSFTAGTFEIGYPSAILNTTIATLSSQTSFTLTTGPAEDDALNGMWCIIHDVASAVQFGRALILDYTGSTKTVTLAAGTTFTAAASDNFSVIDMAPLQATTLGRTLDVSAGGEAGLDWANIGSPTTTVALSGTSVLLTSGTGTGQLSLSSGTVTVGTNNDKTGYALTQSFPTNFSSLAITGGGAVTAGTVSDKTGYSLTQSFPSNFSSLAITAGGIVQADLQTIKTQTVTCSGGVTIPAATLASTSNITAVGAVSGAVGSVTGDVGGNVTGSVGSVVGLTASDVGAIKTKTDFLPSAIAGAAGGVFIAGTNAPVTITGSGNALTLTSTGGNGHGLAVSGNGSGEGLIATGGATGNGIQAVGGATSGSGLYCVATTSGAGLAAIAAGNNNGFEGTGAGNGAGLAAYSGANGDGFHIEGTGTGHAMHIVADSGNGFNFEVTSGGDIVGNMTGSVSGSVGSVTARVTANTDQLAGQTVTAAAGVTFPGTLASTTNITAASGVTLAAATHTGAVIPTVTTLTNDPSGVTTLLSRIPSGIFTGMTSLAQWLGLIAGKQTGNTTARTELRATGAGSGTFDETTDSVEAIRDRGDSAWTTATGFSTLDAAGVRSAVGLASANLDTQLTAIDEYLDTEVAAIKAKTDQLTFTVANQVDANALSGGGGLDAAGVRAAVGLAAANLDTQLGAIDDYLDTEVAAIKAKTDNLPTDPADQSAVEAAITAATSPLATTSALSTVGTNVSTAVTQTTASSIRSAVGMSSANLDTQLGDIPTNSELTTAITNLLTTQMTEAYAADGTAPTLAQCLFLIQQSLHEFSISGTTRTVKKLDGTTTAATFTLDSSTAPTSTTRAT